MAGASEAHGATGITGGGAHAPLPDALQVPAVALRVRLMSGDIAEGQPPQQRIDHVFRNGSQEAESFAGHGRPFRWQGTRSRPPAYLADGTDTIDTHPCQKVKPSPTHNY